MLFLVETVDFPQKCFRHVADTALNGYETDVHGKVSDSLCITTKCARAGRKAPAHPFP